MFKQVCIYGAGAIGGWMGAKLAAVGTSTPWLKARRAATWLAPISAAMSSSVAKAGLPWQSGASAPACAGSSR